MGPTVFRVETVLFDMDGTLIDSTPGVMKAWEAFSKTYGFDVAVVSHAAHGRRLVETLEEFCNIHDTDALNAECARFEKEVIEGGPVALPGAISLINQIETGKPPGVVGWTIVTSATNFYTPRALEKCGIPLPPVGPVTSNDVSVGKPDPAPYLTGAEKCGVEPSKCIVIEDAPSGLRAGRAAGAKTLAVCTSHTKELIVASGTNPDCIAADLTKVSARWVDGLLELVIDD